MIDLAATTAGNLEIPTSILMTIGAGMVSAIVYVFHLLIASHERRARELLEQMLTDRAESEETKKQYTAKLESLVQEVTAQHERTRSETVGIIAANSEAIRLNTAARDVTNKQVSQLMPEITSVVILKLFELGVIPTLHKSANAHPLEVVEK